MMRIDGGERAVAALAPNMWDQRFADPTLRVHRTPTHAVESGMNRPDSRQVDDSA